MGMARLIFAYGVLIFATTALVSSECVPAFSTPENAPYYDVCKETPCILFRTEEPFVFLDPKMTSLEHQRPFLCSEYLKQHDGQLRGALFKFIQRIKPVKDAYCVWAGPGKDCPFGGMLDFVNKSGRSGYAHRWIVGNCLYSFDYKISNYTIPSLPLYDDRLRIIGPPIKGYSRPSDAWNTLLKVFKRTTWYYIASSLLILLFLRAVVASICTALHGRSRKFEWKQWFNRLFDTENTYKRRGERQEVYWRSINKWWLFSAKIFVGLTLLLWEIAIAVEVFKANLEAPSENIDPSRVAVIRNSSAKAVFKDFVNSSEEVWHEVDTIEELYKVVLNETNNIDYTVEYGVRNRYQMKTKPEICRRLRIYDEFPSQIVENRKPPTLYAVWFFSATIPLELRLEINEAISRNQKERRFQKFIEDIAGDDVADSCKLKNNSIDWLLLALLQAV